MLSASPRALSWFLGTPEAPYSSLRSKLRREEAMAKSRGRLYLGMCLAAALASFLAGFLVGKCANPAPSPGQLRLGAAGKPGLDCAGLLPPAELISVRDGELPQFQPNRKPNGTQWAFLIK